MALPFCFIINNEWRLPNSPVISGNNIILDFTHPNSYLEIQLSCPLSFIFIISYLYWLNTFLPLLFPTLIFRCINLGKINIVFPFLLYVLYFLYRIRLITHIIFTLLEKFLWTFLVGICPLVIITDFLLLRKSFFIFSFRLHFWRIFLLEIEFQIAGFLLTVLHFPFILFLLAFIFLISEEKSLVFLKVLLCRWSILLCSYAPIYFMIFSFWLGMWNAYGLCCIL